MKRSVGLILATTIFAAACSNSGATDSTESTDSSQSTPSSQVTDSTTQSGTAAETIPPVVVEGQDVVSALADPSSNTFADPLIPLERIRSGGPPPDGIPPIESPFFVSASQIDWLADNEPVLVLEYEGEARAYPIQIMTWHEIVNDVYNGVPVTVSYCPLCNSATAYVARLADGTDTTFGTSGKLYNSSLIMYDRSTESLWTHFDGKAVVGSLVGEQLELLPVSTVSWADFKENFGLDALVLSKTTGFLRDYGRNPYVGYDNIDVNPFLFDGELDGRLAAQTRVVAVRGEESVVIPQELLGERRVIEFTLDGEDLVALFIPGTSTALETNAISDGRDVGATGVFRSALGSTPVNLLASDTEDRFVDQLGNVYNIAGKVLEGPNAGEQLERVEALNTFWFAIAAFRPDSIILA